LNFNKLKIWAVTDGSQGMISQVIGLSQQLSKNITYIKTDLIFPWNKLQPGFLPIYKWIFKNKIPEYEKPDMIISCGRKSVYFSLYCKKKFYKLINVHIQNPKTSPKQFNYIISPNHDNFYGNNVLNSVGALHQFTKSNHKINSKLLTCIIGGDNQHYYFGYKEVIKLCNKLIKLKKNHANLDLQVITSRRTSVLVKKIINQKLNNIANIWNGDGNNPYEEAIKISSFFIVTSDSTSMISEAAISGRPIYIFHLPFKRKSLRISSFHSEFKKLGITRDLEKVNKLVNWKYNLLNESERIGSILKKRIIEDNL
tara:strand:- start:7231 stop:8166 length:936 start_codon:yes stop_codon:yes gene_type:complete